MAIIQIPIKFFVATSIVDMQTNRLKFLRKLSLIGLNRRDAGSAAPRISSNPSPGVLITPSIIRVGYRDRDDYISPHIADFTHQVDNNSTTMVLWQLGQFRQRKFFFEHTANAPLTLTDVELEVDFGES